MTENDFEIAVKALNKISEWDLPSTGKYWDDDKSRPISYEAQYGSNGVRDYIRAVAKEALQKILKNH